MRLNIPFPRARAGGRTSDGPRLNPWLLVPLVLAAVAALVFWRLSSGAAQTAAPTTATVAQGDLTITVTGGGTVAPARTVDVPFQQSGTVVSVDVKVGQQVKAGEVLARLDGGDLELQLAQAQANLKAAEARLEQTKTGSATPQDLAIAQASLSSARAQLDKTRKGTATAADITSAQAQLDAAQAKLAALKNPAPAALSSAQAKVAQAQSSLQNTRDSSSQSKTNAQLALDNAVNALTQAQSKFATAQQNWQYVQETGNDPVQPSKTGSDGKSTDNTLTEGQRQQYADTFVQAQAALQSAENAVSQARVAYDTARQKEVTDVAQAEVSLKDAEQQLAAVQNPTPSDLAQAQASVTQAQASLTKLRQGGTASDIAQSQAQVTQAQANLEKLTAPAAEPDIASAEASVLQAQVQVDAAQRSLDQATLKAPFDGVVSAVAATPGSIAGTGSAAVTLIDRSKLHIEVSLSETDAARVQIGQPVELTFDALPSASVTGTVATIAPAATVQQNVVTYPVQVEFDPGDTPVKIGMSANADVEIQRISGATLVPSRAVQTAGGGQTVTVLQGEERIPVTVQVETGVTSDGQTEILSCVETGDQCLRTGDLLSVPATTRTTTTTQQNRAGTFGPGGGNMIPIGGGR